MTHFLSKLALAAAFAAAPFAVSSASAADIGLLGCHSDGSTGFVIGSSDKLVCQFTPAGDGPRELYAGNLDKFGLDVGVTGRTTMQVGPSYRQAPAPISPTVSRAAIPAPRPARRR